ncbi:MAG: AraC family transcriptional regulator [Bacteroidota bacterium]|nr:AraC family transcriptional regulator [Bacteroidota bacterium]
MKPILAKRPGFQVREDRFDYLDSSWHYHEEYEFTFIDYPAGKRIIGNHVDTFKEKELVMLGPNLPHAWRHIDGVEDKTIAARSLALHFSESCFGERFFSLPELHGIHTVLKKSKRGMLIKGQTRQKISEWMNEMLDTTTQQRVIRLLQILDLLSSTEDYELLSTEGYWENLTAADRARMDLVYKYILNNFTEEISLPKVSAIANISVPAFCRFFKLRTKKTFTQYINDLRVNYACKLLIETNNSIAQICYESGFNNLSNFNRQFKEIKGSTPAIHRKSFL